SNPAREFAWTTRCAPQAVLRRSQKPPFSKGPSDYATLSRTHRDEGPTSRWAPSRSWTIAPRVRRSAKPPGPSDLRRCLDALVEGEVADIVLAQLHAVLQVLLHPRGCDGRGRLGLLVGLPQ